MTGTHLHGKTVAIDLKTLVLVGGCFLMLLVLSSLAGAIGFLIPMVLGFEVIILFLPAGHLKILWLLDQAQFLHDFLDSLIRVLGCCLRLDAHDPGEALK